ncbi:MAG: PQQ-dependent sugar dehydrogenase, partial [Chloroflexota bacterium]
SAGLRDLAFDPDFATNGYVYAFYTKDDVLQNRVVRLKANATNPDIADTTFGEQLLIDLPFNSTFSSGSHNGGALEFGTDGKLYITTGDGWTGEFAGDPVQSLSTFTGKVLRINSDGSIPADNPFYTQTTGDYRAIYALGLRNPYSMSIHPDTGDLYINEARGTNKADIYIAEAGANYGHEGDSIGTSKSPWANGSGAGGELITGGAWYPQDGPFPADYHGRYFVALWGGNNDATGRIATIQSASNTTVETFESSVGQVGSNGLDIKPVITRIGPDGNLYYMLTTYTTNSGTIQMVRYTAQETVASPVMSPNGGSSLDPVTVTLSTTTADATIYYTTDNTDPSEASTLYTGPISISESTILKARAYKDGLNPSGISSALFTVGTELPNEPPNVDVGPDLIGTVGQSISLDGSSTTDPDGDDNFLTDEEWRQLSGPIVTINDKTEEVATFTPNRPGTYQFELSMSDGKDFGSDQVVVTVFAQPRAADPLALYTFFEGSGATVHDVSGSGTPLDLTIQNAGNVSWSGLSRLTLNSATSLVSRTPADKITDACQASNEMTIEAWIQAADLDQSGPARIVSMSETIFERNVTLGQEGDSYDGRIRTTVTNDNGETSMRTTAGVSTAQLSHVVLTIDGSGSAKILIDGVQAAESNIGGNLSNWDDSYYLILGNERSNDRPWLGTFALVAIYCEALTQSEIQSNISAGLPFSIVDDEQIYLPYISR